MNGWTVPIFRPPHPFSFLNVCYAVVVVSLVLSLSSHVFYVCVCVWFLFCFSLVLSLFHSVLLTGYGILWMCPLPTKKKVFKKQHSLSHHGQYFSLPSSCFLVVFFFLQSSGQLWTAPKDFVRPQANGSKIEPWWYKYADGRPKLPECDAFLVVYALFFLREGEREREG